MNNKIKQFIAFCVCSVVALALCLGVLVVTVNNLDSDTTTTENKTIINKTELNSSEETLASYINTLISETENRFVKTKTYTDISVNDITVAGSFENQDKAQALINYVKDKMHSEIDGFYCEDSAGSFEKDDSKKLTIQLNENQLKNADFSIGQVDENGESVFDDQGNPVDNEFYYLTFEINGETVSNDKKLSKMFSVDADISAKIEFINAVRNNCTIENFEAKPDSFLIKVKVNRANDEIQYINIIKNYAVTIDATFINDAEFLGKKIISFNYTVTDTYEYSYAGITFVENEIDLGIDEEQMLNVNAVIDNDSEYSVEFLSSDENITSVDEMGYVKGLKNSNTPVIITVKLNYLGETFTDTCAVNVSEG